MYYFFKLYCELNAVSNDSRNASSRREKRELRRELRRTKKRNIGFDSSVLVKVQENLFAGMEKVNPIEVNKSIQNEKGHGNYIIF